MADFDLGGLLFGDQQSSGLEAYLDPEQLKRMQQQGVMQAAMALLKASGPSRTPVGFGQALGEAYGAGQAGYQQAQQQGIAGIMTKQKLEEAAADRRLAESLSSGDMGASFGLTPEQARIVAMNPKAMLPEVLKAQLTRKEAGKFTPMTAQQLSMYGLPAGTSAVINDLTGKPEILSTPDKPQAEPDTIRTLRAFGLEPTVANLRLLDKPDKPEASPTEVKLLQAAGMPVTMENIMALRRSIAPSSNVTVTGDKVRAGEINKDIVAQMGDFTAQARSATDTLMNVDRMLPALKGAITGPMADSRTTLIRVGQQLGIVGKDANDVLAKTQILVQGLAQQELAAAGQMKGQGAITAPERELLRRASVGDQNLSAAELKTALETAQKVARYRIGQHQEYLSKFSTLPGSEQYVPFYSVTPYQPAGGANPTQTGIDAELARRAQQQRGGGMR
jgi:hypothetical protein